MTAGALLALAGPAFGQAGLTPAESLRLENQRAMERSMDRQRSLSAERESFAREQRARTGYNLQSLRGPVAVGAPDARIAADEEAMARRRAEALAASNARILAIRPASE